MAENKVYGELTITNELAFRGKVKCYVCVCSCGNTTKVPINKLKTGHTRSCGCLKKRKGRKHAVQKNLLNQRFGKLLVLELLPERSRHSDCMWLCKCDCGVTKPIRTSNLLSKNYKSCGCLKREAASKRLRGKTGKLSHSYKLEISEEERKVSRRHWEYNEWRRLVHKSCDYTCQICGRVGGFFEAHHLNSWKLFPKQRFNVENGVSLCQPCHKAFHKALGNSTTISDFIEYKNNYDKEKND